ncbi:polyadenylate-binding protein 8-like isoform X2 [Lotus japonicus]|uniref:polyadenylate-binding protein 8-like isoform X2 n=1 Tax=Lotus japonicus TaxID=34305 RepID=UPI002585EE61|nr:polyadenylate-binding protein 8-like isoform X2 [Lotus japonicus]
MAQIHETDAVAQEANQPMPTSLYVGDLDTEINDSQLYDLFNQIGQVVSVRVCRDLATQQSLGYGYVNFTNPKDAATALDVLNFTPLNGKPIRIMYSHRDPSVRKSGAANIFVKNLDKSIDHKALYDTFLVFGNILTCKIATDGSGQSKGYGFVQFENEESAQNAIDNFNGKLIGDKEVYVSHFQRKQDRENAALGGGKFNNVYVKNLSEAMTDDDLKKIFSEYGTITSAVVMRDVDGKSKCFGFVNFENADEAAKAVDALNGKKFDDKEWYVGKAKKKSERELELKEQHEQSMQETVDKYQGANLYLKNLDDNVDDEKLRELFSEFGTITSCKIMRDPHGVSRGSGFVAFSTPEEATRALGEMNGKMVDGKPLYVALAQKKEERRAKLQGGYFQQQLLPGMRPGGGPLSNFYVPLGHQGQQGQRPGGRLGAGPMQQPQQPVPLMQQQMHPRGRVYRYRPGHNLQNVPLPGAAGGVGVSIQALATALADATPEKQRTMLGEVLYPLVDKLEHDAAAKLTGMLLEMDQTEVLHLIESPDALKAKVAEAMDVLRNVARQQSNTPIDQLASLSLNDLS